LDSRRKRQLLVVGIKQRERLEGLIDPGKRVATDEQLLAQLLSEIRQAPAEAGTQLRLFEQQ
jgi:hypothetical protein